MKKSLFLLFIIMFNLANFISCDKNPVAPNVGDVQGYWSGDLDPSGYILFRVEDSYIEFYSIQFKSGNTTVNISDYAAEVKLGSNMKFKIVNSGSPTLTINGEFKSKTKCKGSFQWGSTSDNWEASPKEY